MRVLSISASNNMGIKETSSKIICKMVNDRVKEIVANAECSIIELREYMPTLALIAKSV